MYKQTKILNTDKKTIHLELFVDESKNRPYEYGETEQKITYIMIMAVPTNKKELLYNKINNSRCLNDKVKVYGKCTERCSYHDLNNSEIHYTKIDQSRVKYSIANKWIDILLDNNKLNEEGIYFNILGIIETNLNNSLFGTNKQFGNIYSRFFRTNLLRLLKMFYKYDHIIIDKIYHDKTSEMENHPYFKNNVIKKIRLSEVLRDRKKVIFKEDEIEFIDSNHNIGMQVESQFIQFVDIILGVTLNVIHNTAKTDQKKELTRKIKPLISRILDKRYSKNINSSYNYFNKQCISFFPKYSKEKLKFILIDSFGYYDNIEKLLEDSRCFENTKTILFEREDNEQISFFT